jgi:hypothetical protein
MFACLSPVSRGCRAAQRHSSRQRYAWRHLRALAPWGRLSWGPLPPHFSMPSLGNTDSSLGQAIWCVAHSSRVETNPVRITLPTRPSWASLGQLQPQVAACQRSGVWPCHTQTGTRAARSQFSGGGAPPLAGGQLGSEDGRRRYCTAQSQKPGAPNATSVIDYQM